MRRLEEQSIADGETAKSKRSQAFEFLLRSRLEKEQTEQFLPQKGELLHPFAVVWRREYNLCPTVPGHRLRGMGLARCWMEVFLCGLTSELNEVVGIYGLGD